MNVIRIASVSTLALLAILQTTDTASADHRHRMRILWPKIFAPEFTGYLYRDESAEEDEGFFDLEDEDDYYIRSRRDRRIVLELYDDEELEPQYVPPRKAKPKKAVKNAVKKPVAKSTETTASIVKPKIKPLQEPLPKVAATSVPVVAPLTSQKTKTSLVSQAAAAKPPTVKPAAPKAQLASTAPAAGTIGCSKGAEIVSGYGFTSVKPRNCSGTDYSFDASRGANGYLIKLSATTGEITDVTKLK